MNVDILLRAWYFSGRKAEPSSKIQLKNRIKYMLAVVKNYAVSVQIFDNQSARIRHLLNQRPEYCQIMIAPYMNSSWGVNERVCRFFNHLDALDKFDGKFDFELSKCLLIYDFKSITFSGYRIVIDKPIWFHREGLLALNICKSDVRIYTLPFSIETVGDDLEFIIGGIQGRNIDNMLDEYKIFTKLFYGIRPRDFLIETLRMLANILKVSRILAVSDECRHHRHPYFGKNSLRHLPANYNEIWMDRGGFRHSHSMFVLPLSSVRDIDAVAPKKRAMYKKRYELLRQIENEIAVSFSDLKPTPAVELK